MPFVETWLEKASPLGTVGDIMGRKVYRFTAADDFSNASTFQRVLQTTRGHPGSPLHGSLPCTATCSARCGPYEGASSFIEAARRPRCASRAPTSRAWSG